MKGFLVEGDEEEENQQGQTTAEMMWATAHIISREKGLAANIFIRGFMKEEDFKDDDDLKQ